MESDVLSNLLKVLHLEANVYLHADFCDTWVVDVSGKKKVPFHVVGSGHCWLHTSGAHPPLELSTGDLVVFPHDSPHCLANTRAAPGPDIPRNRPVEGRPQGVHTTLVCGNFDIERRFWNPLLESLPDVVVSHRRCSAGTRRQDLLIDAMLAEVGAGGPGSKAIVDRLGGALFIHVVRASLRDALGGAGGYAKALADRHVGRALMAIHERPGDKWTVESLAAVAGLSRSAFAERFQKLVAMAPMRYLTRWRMRQAHERLVTGYETVGRVAELCGYESEAAFSRVFKKYIGAGPGEVRRQSTGS